MAINKTFLHLNTMAQAEHDAEGARKKVATWVYNNSVSYEDTSFVTGDSPAKINVYSDLGTYGHGGYISNDGSGSMLIEFSNDGTTYGGQHTLNAYEVLEFNDMTVAKIRITWVSNTSYRILVV